MKIASSAAPCSFTPPASPRAGAGLVIAGFAGAGKSTLALEIMGHGTDFISNDRVMVSRQGQTLTMAGVAKMPRINPGTVLNNPNLASVMNAEDRARFFRPAPGRVVGSGAQIRRLYR